MSRKDGTVDLRIERDALHDAAAMVARVAGLPPWDAMTAEVDGDKLTLSASDGDVACRTVVAVSAAEAGTVALSAKRFAAAVASLRPGAVEVVEDATAVKLTSGPSAVTLPMVDADVVPRPTLGGEGEAAVIDGAALRRALGRVVPAASRDAARPVLTGVLFHTHEGRLRLAATDSYRLHVDDVGVDWPGEPMLVPALALRELAKLPKSETVALGGDDMAVSFGVGDTLLTARLLAGDFPNYPHLIPATTPHRAVVDAAELVEAVKRVTTAAKDVSTCVRLAFSGDTVRLSVGNSVDTLAAVDEVDVEWSGSTLDLAFTPRFLIEALECAAAERVSLGLTSALHPVVLRAEPTDAWQALLMPVRVS